MSEWHSKLHEFFTNQEPFVVATITSFEGSSPDQPGSYALFSNSNSVSFVRSEHRREHMLGSAIQILDSRTAFKIEQVALGDVAGYKNGNCTITYEYFAASVYPDWLRTIRSNRHNGINCVLVREFTGDESATEIQERVVSVNTVEDPITANFIKQHPPPVCAMYKNLNGTVLVRACYNHDVPLILVGDHAVLAAIETQIKTLPIAARITHTNSEFAEHLADNNLTDSYLIIITGDHDLDFQYCQQALQNPTLHFVGCLGSNKKARIFNDKLIQNGIQPAQLKKLHMPIGLADISGKQTSVIALSIIAQVMSLHR